MKKLTLTLFLLFATNCYAEYNIEKEYCSSSIDYNSIEELKLKLLTKAKIMVSNEMFGELIYSSTAVKNSILTQDIIESSSIGLIRLNKNPVYYNSNNFAEACVNIKSYVTDEDIKKFNPIEITKKQCHADHKLTTSELKKKTEEQAILKALYNYDSRLKEKNPNKVIHLLQRIEFIEKGFIPETETYCAKIKGFLTPVEVMAFLAKKEVVKIKKDKKIENEPNFEKAVKDYYAIKGEWAGRYEIHHIEKMRIENVSDITKRLHVRYYAVPVTNNSSTKAQYDQRVFIAIKRAGKYEISQMLGYYSAKF